MNRRHFVAAILGAAAASRLPENKPEHVTDKDFKFKQVTIRGEDLYLKIKPRG